ncbi:MAG: SAM-dependent methyltransferase [Deltaproteobacteria bacterium]|nr:MAG: SAM-dependent methyltransferase [Deltaproteobacteria bacterium]
MSDRATPEETLDPLAGPWKIFQLRRGHRFSIDDMVTAWRAACARPFARHALDLGCGIGSVGLATLWQLRDPRAALVGVEAQEVSATLARRTVAYNQLEDRVTIVGGDLRDPQVVPPSLCPAEGFQLITGSPPYLPPTGGILPAHPQKAGARFELRGSVYDYCQAAARWLAPDGRFAFVMLAADPRTEDAPIQAGLHVVERLDVTFRHGKPPHVAVLVCAHRSAIDPDRPRQTLHLTVRDAEGNETPELLAFRRAMSGDGEAAQARRRETGRAEPGSPE